MIGRARKWLPASAYIAETRNMTQSAWTSEGIPVDAGSISSADWELLKQQSQLGDFVLPCCKAPAVLKTSINGLAFFSHLTNECATAPETVWHENGKAAVLAALHQLGLSGRDEVTGTTPAGIKWKADVLFTVQGRTIAIELQRSYQHYRDFIRRQEQYASSNVECYWLARREVFLTLQKATSQILLKRDYGNVFPPEGIGTGSLPEIPIAMLTTDSEQLVLFGGMKSATVPIWLTGIINKSYQYHKGSWNLG